ncbi:MAG TPA: DUF6159 family protein [bacterium]|jgi:hypothetical protein|nr:DUF6159 family protein [bacterium]
MGVFSRSWALTKLSFSVISDDKELLVFPFLSAFFSVLVLGAFWLPLRLFIQEPSQINRSSVVFWGCLFVLYFILTLLSTFFSVCAVHIIKKRLDGGTEGLSESFAFAFSRMNLIIGWSLVSATVSTLLRMLESAVNSRRENNPMGLVVGFIVSLFVVGVKVSWSIVTLFVIPAMVYKDLGPFEAIKDSTQTIKKTWGESLVRNYGLGLIQFFVLLFGLGILVLLAIGLGIGAGSTMGVIIMGALAVAYIVVVFAVFSMADTVYNTALYAYAATGQIPQGFDREVLEQAFKTK